MISIIDCRKCKHERPLKAGWNCCCDAFPDGIPMGFNFGAVKEAKECNNGIGFEEIEKLDCTGSKQAVKSIK